MGFSERALLSTGQRGSIAVSSGSRSIPAVFKGHGGCGRGECEGVACAGERARARVLKRALFIGEVDGIEELAWRLDRYRVHVCCVDHLPEGGWPAGWRSGSLAASTWSTTVGPASGTCSRLTRGSGGCRCAGWRRSIRPWRWSGR